VKTAPIPILDASVSKMNSPSSLGNERTGEEDKTRFNSSNAS